MKTVTQRASSITIFLADGVPDGVRTVVKSGWIGHFTVCPRSRFFDARGGAEFDLTGVYILCGPSDDSDLPTIYVGEGDPTCPRLEQHYRQKDFWTSLILFTAKDQLNKAHVQYLESRLVSLARAAKRCVLDNGNDPQLPALAIADRAAMDGFLEEMLLIFPLLGLTVFEVPSQPIRPGPGKPSPVTKPGPADTMLHLKARGIKARGYDRSEGFVVLAGSEAVGDKRSENLPPSALNVRNGLVKQGVLVPDSDHFKFTQDYSLNSPSQAATVVMGCSANGLREWKDERGRALKDIRVALPDELPDTNRAKPIKAGGAPRLPMPQARVLQALLPVAGDPSSLSHTELAQRMKVSPISGTISVAMGGRSDSPHKGLLDAGLVTKVKGEGNEDAYQITTEGISAIKNYLKEHGKLPPPRDKTLSTNIRYQKDQRDSTDIADADNTNIVDDPHDLNRFVKAQARVYDQALAEVRSGKKRTHWIWFIFPQLNRQGTSPTSENYKFYAIKSIEEAKAYLGHPVLGTRLVECAEAALSVQGRTAHEIFDSPDDKKLRSCATLFASVSQPGSVFDQLLAKYYQGERDSKTLRLLGIAPEGNNSRGRSTKP
jgi:uncharacterized protein (DUF1810 family)